METVSDTIEPTEAEASVLAELFSTTRRQSNLAILRAYRDAEVAKATGELLKDKERLDWVWLIPDDAPVPVKLLPALNGATVLRVPLALRLSLMRLSPSQVCRFSPSAWPPRPTDWSPRSACRWMKRSSSMHRQDEARRRNGPALRHLSSQTSSKRRLLYWLLSCG